MIMVAENWMAASISSLVFAFLIFPILKALEHMPWYDNLFVQKKPGEIKASLLILFGSMAVIVALTWGFIGLKYVAVSTILMWGLGDAAAAVIGIRFGKRKVKWKLADGKKTWEGTSAMAISAFLIGAVSLVILSGQPIGICILQAALAAPVAAVVELVSRDGIDTLSVPVAVAAVLSVMILI